MTGKVSEDLLDEVRRAEESGGQREISVILTINGPANLAELEEKGLKIIHFIEVLPAVSGTVTRDKPPALAELPQVKIIEFDGQVSIASTPHT